MANQGSTYIVMIGLGHMGSALAESQIANELKLTVWNRTPLGKP
jgi:3-hydroxyisobutyrate dehydrogenase-like beta-hydroxyacid dehydrogenase